MAKGLHVRFYINPIKMEKKSKEEGRPIFEDREFVSIIPIGDNKTDVRRQATDNDKMRFAEEYAVFRSGQNRQITGTPLSEWPVLTASQIKQFEYLNIFSVEQLIDIEFDEMALKRCGPGARDLIAQAKAFVARAKDSSVTHALASEKAALQEQLADMRRQFNEMAAEVRAARAETPVRRRRGRPAHPVVQQGEQAA